MLVSITVLVLSVLIVTLGKEAPSTAPTQSLYEGKLFYFAVIFFFALSFVDILYETLPYVFSKMKAQFVRSYVIYAYIFYINVTTYLYLQTNTSYKWNK